MPRIYVEFAGLKQIENDCKTISSALNKIQSDFRRSIKQLDWDIKFQSDIDNKSAQLFKKLSEQIAILKSFQNFINEAYEEYQKLNNIEFDKNALNISSLIDEAESSSGFTSEFFSDEQFYAWLNLFLTILYKTKSDNTAGVTSKIFSYFKSLYTFFTGDIKGLTGAEDWFDLGDKSIGLWTNFYDYLKNFYNGTGNIFSVSNQTKVAGINIIGSLFGLVSSIFGAADTISNTENIGTAGIIGQLFGISDDVVDILENITKFKNIDNVAQSGLFSPIKLYTSIAKGYLSAIGQIFMSYEKYASDGSWDLGDTAATGIESSVSGLYSMVSALTYGLISEQITGISASDISGALENISGDIGTRAGNYISNDSTLYQMYQESNTIGKAVITFYAALMSY